MVSVPGVGLVDGGGTPSATASSRNSPATSSMHQAAHAKSKTAHASANGLPPPPPNPLSSMKSAPLDLASVERRGQPTACKEPMKKKNRPHGLQEAPTYYPSEEDWKDPFEYIRKISPEARQFGICKIVPPETWNPDFAIDTEKFHFKTRKQELNSIEGSSRANLSYVDGLLKFHKQQGLQTQNRLPFVDKKPLDLFRLKKAVEARGGFDKVCKLKKWAEIGRDLGYSGKIMSSLSTSLKNSYAKWIQGYEDYLAKAKPGVHQQLELEYGGPLTPSPAPSPMKRSAVNTPSSLRADSPAKHASDVLQATVNGHADRDTPMADASPLTNPKAGGFTAINSGGFTSVNSSFTSVNRSLPGAEPRGISTPKSFTPLSSAKNTPEYRPSGLGGTSTLKRQLSCDSLDSSNKEINGTDPDEAENGSRRSKRLKKDNVPTVAGSHMSLLRPSVPRIPRDESIKPGEKCEACGKGGDARSFLLICESCDHAYHGACLEPPVKSKPDTEWNCPRCLVGDGQFGFEEGGLYSLKQFQEKAADFKQGYFENKMPYDPVLNCHRPVTEDDVEREFWRLVADLEETVEVEYGADIHCTTHGSGFPTAEKNPDNSYSTDPWNLNILPYHPESLFRYIKSDISGMTVPWVYVGMIFSTFCWHAEDHYSYSANYQHFGATKTWYGIPGEDADRFENAMREAVPELFETQPDLLFQLVTLLTPEQLQKAGVRVYALDQRAGQLVITFPQAYHAGFNHGFNFNEAVNFAPCDWEPFGLLGVQKLQQFRRQPCFSHDELLWTAAEGTTSSGLTIQTAKWLAPALDKVCQRETAQRDAFTAKHLEFLHGCPFGDGSGEECPLTFTAEDVEVSEEESCCIFCKAFSYLSRFKCLKSGRVLCLLHAGDYKCCDAPEADRYFGKDHVLFYRKTLADIEATLKKVSDKANLPEAWEAKYQKLLDEEGDPSLKALRALLLEGEKIPYDLPSLPTLREFVERCNVWVDEATTYVVRKQQNRRKNDKAWQSSSRKSIGNSYQDQKERDMRSVDNVYRLLGQAEQIGFDCPEITQLQERAEAIKSFQANANKALENRQSETAERIEELLDEGQTFSVDIPEVEKLARLLDRLKWEEKARSSRGVYISLGDVQDLIEEGERLGIPAYNDSLQHYRAQLATGQQWEKKAQELIHADTVHYPQLQALSDQAAANCLPVSPETLALVDQILFKQREAHRQIIDLNKRIQDHNYKNRPQYSEVAEVMKKVEELQAKPSGTLDLEREQRRHEDWMRKGKKLFGKTNAPLHILKSHMEYVLDRNLECFNIIDDKPRQVPAEPLSREPSPDPETDKANRWDEQRLREVFCICRRTEAGMMIECELCHEWYHGKCLKIARGKVKEDDKYTCPICDWRVKIPRDAARPKLEDLIAWYEEVPHLPFQPEEEEVLKKIVDNAQEFRAHIAPYCNPMLSTRSEAVTQRFYLRKIEGAEILLAFETNFFRQELHKWCPVAPDPPPVLEESKSTRKPRPTKLQKLLNEYGVDDPDELPEHVRGKANSLKRKALNAEAAAQAASATPPSAKSNATLNMSALGPGSYVPAGMHFIQRNSIPDMSPSPTGLSAQPSGGPGSSSSTQSRHARSNSLRDEPAQGFPSEPYPHLGALFGNGPEVTLTDNSTLSLEERLLRDHPEKEDGDLPVNKAKALEIFARTEEGRRKAEELYGRDVWDRQKAERPDASTGGGSKAQPDENDPLGIGVENEGEGAMGDTAMGDVDRMFGELVNQDQEDEDGASKRDASAAAAAAEDNEHASSSIDALLDGE